MSFNGPTRFSAALMTFVLFNLAGAARAQEIPPDIKEFKYITIISYEYDTCFGGNYGRRTRAAYINTAQSCPFTDEAKRHFGEWVASKNSRFALDYDEYVEKHSRLPENPKDISMLKFEGRSVVECRNLRNPSILNFFVQGEKRLSLYERGEVSLDDYIHMQGSYDRCRPFSLPPAPRDTPMR